jgi:flagellar basal body rod protein FlgG
MEVSLYQAAAAMSATAQWQDLIAENLSASSVPGSRKQEISFTDVQAGLTQAQAGSPGSSFSLTTARKVTNFQPGELHATGNPMNFALEGPGFFAIKTPTGQTGYTRDGEFQLNAGGQLVDKQGNLVLGDGRPMQFQASNPGTITVSTKGDVAQGDTIIGKLRTYEFKNPDQLTMTGSGIFTPNGPAAGLQPSSSTKVRQGYLEAANASPTTQMSSLITAMRLFEANQKVLQMQGDRMSKVISDLGGTT